MRPSRFVLFSFFDLPGFLSISRIDAIFNDSWPGCHYLYGLLFVPELFSYGLSAKSCADDARWTWPCRSVLTLCFAVKCQSS